MVLIEMSAPEMSQNLCAGSSISDVGGPKICVEEILRLPLFEGVNQAIIERLVPHFSLRQYRAGTMLLAQGESVSCYCVITRGIVDLVRIDGDHESGVLLLSSGDLVMPSAVTFDEPTLLTVRALTATRTVEIDRSFVKAALEQSTRLSANLMKAISGQWRMAVRNILDLNSRTAAQRLGAFLLRLSDLYQEERSPSVLPISKRHLASRLGITPETLSRTLQIVAEHGLHLRGRSIIVNDRTAIEGFCGPDPYESSDERMLKVFAF